MDRNSAKLLKELKKYYTVQQKSRKSMRAMHVRESRRLGISDKEVQKMLKGMGVDAPALIKASHEAAQKLGEARHAFLDNVRPPTFPGKFAFENPSDPNVFLVKPPAISSIIDVDDWYPDNTEYNLNPALGEIRFKSRFEGGGLGWFGDVVPAASFTLVFEFTPPQTGIFKVDAYLDLNGQFIAWAEDHVWSSPDAFLRLTVSSRVYQSHWVDGPSLTVLDEYRHDSSNIGWVDPRRRQLSYTPYIFAANPLLIFVEIKFQMMATGHESVVEVDFMRGENCIKVPGILFRYINF